MKTPIRIGIIGTGKHGSRYASHVVKDLANYFRLSAISRRSPEGHRQAHGWSTTCCHDWRDLVDSDQVDAVIAVTTPDLNLDIAKRCAAHQKPLLLEKPIATDYRVAREIVDLFKKHGVPLTAGQTLRYNSVIRLLRHRIEEMGQLYSFFACQRLEPSSLPWLEEPDIAGGGVIYHTAVHMFDALRFITRLEPVRVRGSVRSIFNPRLEDLLVAEVEFEGGVLGILDTSKVGPSRAGRYEFICENGQLHGEQIHGMVQKIGAEGIKNLEVESPGPAILPLLKDWYTFLMNRGENPIPGEEGLEAVKLCHATQLSVERDNWVELQDLL